MGKAVPGTLVLWSIVRHVLRTYSDLARHELAVNFRPIDLALAALVYLAGLLCSALLYHDMLKTSGAPIGSISVIRAHLISHLGKYLPVKAIVVIMRASLSAASGARLATAAIATFYETLVRAAGRRGSFAPLVGGRGRRNRSSGLA